MVLKYSFILTSFIIILITGCTLKEYDESLPSMEIEATVISLSIDENIECENKCPRREYPKDSGTIRIDKIVSVTDDQNRGLKGIEIMGKDNIKVRFGYSSRPTKIIMIPPSEPTLSDDGRTVRSPPSSNGPVLKQDDYFIYAFENALVEEETIKKILPGLVVGSKFRAVTSLPPPLESSKGNILDVYEYEIIS